MRWMIEIGLLFGIVLLAINGFMQSGFWYISGLVIGVAIVWVMLYRKARRKK